MNVDVATGVVRERSAPVRAVRDARAVTWRYLIHYRRVPQLLVFSTNLDPKELVDEAFLRRIKYKIEITSPTRSSTGRSSARSARAPRSPTPTRR